MAAGHIVRAKKNAIIGFLMTSEMVVALFAIVV